MSSGRPAGGKSQNLKKRTESKEKNYREVVYTRVGKVKKPTKTFHQRLQYDFLQYIRIIFKWACDNHEISRPHLELILCMYPVGIFRKDDFRMYARTIDMQPDRLFNKLIDDGWLKLWRPAKRNQAALYSLTTRGKILCGKVHKMCLGESKIPESKYVNTLGSSEKNIDKYYMEVIKQMNKRNPSEAKDVQEEENE